MAEMSGLAAATLEVPDPNSPTGLDFLQNYLLSRSYVSGFVASQHDASLFRAFRREPPETYENVLRWYRHLKSMDRKELPEGPKELQVVVQVEEVLSSSLPPSFVIKILSFKNLE